MYKNSSNSNLSHPPKTTAASHVWLWLLRVLLSLLLLLFYKMSIAQTKGSAKLYGYVQAVSGGAAPDRSSDPGAVAAAEGRNYYIYLASANSLRVYPSEMWLEGKRYGVQIKMVTTPVLHQSTDPALDNKVLVPATKQKVLQIIPTSTSGAKKSAKGEALSLSNDVVVIYKQGSKFHFTTLKDLNTLPRAARQ